MPVKAQAAKKRAVDPFECAWYRHLALMAIAQFAYLYISFGSVLAVASGSYKLPAP